MLHFFKVIISENVTHHKMKRKSAILLIISENVTIFNIDLL